MRKKVLRKRRNILVGIFILLSMQQIVYSQTKQETIDWINSKVPKDPVLYGDYLKFARKMKLNADGSFEVISSFYELPVDTRSPQAASVTTMKGNFKDLSPTSVTVKSGNGLVFVHIKCSGGGDCINTIKTGNSGVYEPKDLIVFGAFYDGEENMSARLKKAFVHLIELCGGRKEAF